MSNRKLLFLLPLVLFIAMVILLFTGLGKDPTKLESQLVGKSLPSFSKYLLLSPEKIISEKDIKGPALINVFASWCPSCYHEHPYLMELSKNKIVRIYGLNYKDKRPAGLKFINDLGNPYELVIFDDNGRLGIDMGVYGAPETFVVDANNKIIYRHVGIVNEEVWLKTLKPKVFSINDNIQGEES
jgi:cytochrome c biogenesis protein CcmG/thiol:disulfide interchange protein DsbE